MSVRRSAPALIIVALLGTSSAWAQLDALKNTTPAERATVQTEIMKTRLGLTDAQTPKVAAINEKYAERMEPIIKGSENPFLKVREVWDIEQAKEADLRGVLSAEQFQKFLDSKAEIRREFDERFRPKGE
jgi:hypothetical protein